MQAIAASVLFDSSDPYRLTRYATLILCVCVVVCMEFFVVYGCMCVRCTCMHTWTCIVSIPALSARLARPQHRG
jgi:hypothetical protein